MFRARYLLGKNEVEGNFPEPLERVIRELDKSIVWIKDESGTVVFPTEDTKKYTLKPAKM